MDDILAKGQKKVSGWTIVCRLVTNWSHCALAALHTAPGANSLSRTTEKGMSNQTEKYSASGNVSRAKKAGAVDSEVIISCFFEFTLQINQYRQWLFFFCDCKLIFFYLIIKF